MAGNITTKGYRQVRLLDKVYFVHRVIWEMYNGPIPTNMQIDHIDGVKDNNNLENLRLATQSQNMSNKGKLITNTSGYKGVSWNSSKNKWRARLTVDGKSMHIGYFDTAEEAYEAYCEIVQNICGDFANTG